MEELEEFEEEARHGEKLFLILWRKEKQIKKEAKQTTTHLSYSSTHKSTQPRSHLSLPEQKPKLSYSIYN